MVYQQFDRKNFLFNDILYLHSRLFTNFFHCIKIFIYNFRLKIVKIFKMKIKFILIIILTIYGEHLANISTNNKKKCELFNKIFSYKLKSFNIEIELKNFITFSQIKFNCMHKFLRFGQVIFFFPKFPLFLDNTLDFSSLSPDQSSVNIQFSRLKGITSDLKIFEILVNKKDSIQIVFSLSDIKLKFSNAQNQSTDSISLFKNINAIYFLNDCTLNLNTSSWMFSKSKINNLIINGLVDTILKKNLLGFSNVVNSISLDGRLKMISKNIFQNLNFLKEINLEENFDIHRVKNGLKFLASLNSNDSNCLKKFTVNLYIYFYEYPDQDFCLFKDFPKNRFILPVPLGNLFFQTELLSVMLLFFTPFFSLLGLTTNFLSIVILCKLIKSKNATSLRVYQCMYLHSVLNFIFAFIYLFHTLNICAYLRGDFCPDISRSVVL
ncbi:hypothetical protein BpHYR1_022674 [Brachionus plicatilis]|uniref:Uncharacterized protein n=1 Tax=Brachionus plicatilis TaxID=10195 RepID=A0A3M7SIV5_BRAPC|nr:hypothetical protein BpHYR1_022674 [Brachionus plicatilis]